ncbi:MAG: Fic/DOC family N-terminal domain-containing protein [Alsobacter sp.]
MSAPVHYRLGEFPPTSIDWAALVPLIGKANSAIARYDGLLAAIPNPGVLLAPLTTQEAVLSAHHRRGENCVLNLTGSRNSTMCLTNDRFVRQSATCASFVRTTMDRCA